MLVEVGFWIINRDARWEKNHFHFGWDCLALPWNIREFRIFRKWESKLVGTFWIIKKNTGFPYFSQIFGLPWKYTAFPYFSQMGVLISWDFLDPQEKYRFPVYFSNPSSWIFTAAQRKKLVSFVFLDWKMCTFCSLFCNIDQLLRKYTVFLYISQSGV